MKVQALRRFIAPAIATGALLAVTAPAASAGLQNQINLFPANNIGSTIELTGVQQDFYSVFTSGDAFIENGTRGSAHWASRCPDVCAMTANADYSVVQSDQLFRIEASNPVSGDNSASCWDPAQVLRCDIAYNRDGNQLNVNTNTYGVGAEPPKASLYLDADPVIDDDDARDGLEYTVGPSRTGEVKTTLAPVGGNGGNGRAARASGAHASGKETVTRSGENRDFELRLNEKGRRAVAKHGAITYRLRAVFRPDDGGKVKETARVRIVP